MNGCMIAHLPVIEALRICITSINALRNGQIFTFHEDVLKECEAALASYADAAKVRKDELSGLDKYQPQFRTDKNKLSKQGLEFLDILTFLLGTEEEALKYVFHFWR